MHDEPDESALIGQCRRNRVDEEGHVVGNDGCHGRKAVVVTPEDDIGRPRRPPCRQLPHEGDLAEDRRHSDRTDVLARHMPGEPGDEEPQLLVLFAFQSRDEVAR